jgi:hypothetical protein
VRVPSWQVEADLAAGPPGAPARKSRTGFDAVAPDVSAVAADLLRRSGTFAHYAGRGGAAFTHSAHNLAHEKNHYSILKPCQMIVVYQAANQSRFLAS